MQKERKTNGYWDNYERCYEAAKSCETRTEFYQKAEKAYRKALKNGWIKDYFWFKVGSKITAEKIRKWSKEACLKEAEKYTTRTDFAHNSGSAYVAALKNGWLDEFTCLERKKNLYADKLDNVYAYIFKEQHAVYVGRTIHPKARDGQHRKHKKGDAVYKFARANNIPIPEMIIVETDLDPLEGSERENYYVKRYHEEGWIVLNIAKTGKNSSSLGAINSGIWNKTSCKNEALKYNTLKDFQENSKRAYSAACKHKWIKEFVWLKRGCKPDGYWNEKTCYEEAKKYQFKKDFKKNASRAYKIARENGWLADYWWFEKLREPKGYWNYEHCYEEAKKYKSRGEFQAKAGSAYNKALKNGWIKDYIWFELNQKPTGYWNSYEHCYEAAKECKSRYELRKKYSAAYKSALRNNWLDDYVWFESKQKSNGYWNYEHCYEEAKKHKSRGEFRNNAGSAYNAALKNGWLDEFFPPVTQNKAV